MARYSDVDNLIDYLTKATGHKATCDGCTDIDCVDCIRDEVIKNLPTADVVEVKHAYWKVCEDECEICASEFVCSNCKESFVSSDLTDEQFLQMLKYCPNCGAKMNGK